MRAIFSGWIVCVSLSIACQSAPATGSSGSGTTASGTTAPASSSSAGSPVARAEEALSAAAAAVLPAKHHEIELAPGTVVAVRLTNALSTVRNRAHDPFTAILEEPVVVNDSEALPSGTTFTGHVTTSQESGRLKGRAVLSITLDAFEYKGRRYPIATSVDTRASDAHKSRNIKAVGGGAGLGALIGGLAGGGKGVAIGAAIGAGAGTGAAAATGKMDVEIPAETLFRFSLKMPVTIVD